MGKSGIGLVQQWSIDAHVLHDGSVAHIESAELRDCVLPPALVDLALGFLAENDEHVNFVWTGHPTGALVRVAITQGKYAGFASAHLRATVGAELPFALTRRELDVVTLLIGGLASTAIAESLSVSTRTVTTHIDHVMRKFDAPNRSTVATRALDIGLVGLPFPLSAPGFETLRVGRLVRSAGTRGPRKRWNPRPAAEAQPIVIGALVPVAGRGLDDGVEMLNGARLAIEEINARGGIHGREIRMEVAGLDIDESASVRATVDELLRKKIDVITSGYLAGQDLAIEAASVEGVPFMHSSASSVIGKLVASNPERYKGVFQFCPSDALYASNFVAFMTELRDSRQWTPSSTRLAVVQQSLWEIVDFGIDAATRLAAEQGWELTTVGALDRRDSTSAWASAAHEVRATRAAAVMLGSFFAPDHAQFVDSFLTEPTDTLLYSIYAPSVPAFRRLVDDRSEGIVWATTTGTYSDRLGHEFASRYTTRFGRPPGRSHACISYDRVHILAQAWGQLTDIRDFDAVTARIADVRYRGVNGAYSFAPYEHSTLSYGSGSWDPSLSQAHATYQVQNGRNVMIAPAIYASGTFRRPPWIPARPDGAP
ncbi:ABC transporter substrate-binding protein [Rhodococcus sp. NPDC057529]|uniref:ABC transporter substrate-binding protein n=1 Tax=Rhodococcus sp. NPDC057529 TaxID=3346158 RepID=UPI0036713E85